MSGDMSVATKPEVEDENTGTDHGSFQVSGCRRLSYERPWPNMRLCISVGWSVCSESVAPLRTSLGVCLYVQEARSDSRTPPTKEATFARARSGSNPDRNREFLCSIGELFLSADSWIAYPSYLRPS